MFINHFKFSKDIEGFGEASKVYFNKPINDLNLTESAILAGTTFSPTYYSPLNENEKWRTRSKDVLRNMKEKKYITNQQYEESVQILESCNLTLAEAKAKSMNCNNTQLNTKY